jgi:ABC-2 type transport system ATP-binding protein
MQETFIDFIKEEKARGKTILLSSHIFSEVDATCDRISIIKDGHLLSTFVANDLRHSASKTFKLEFSDKPEFERFRKQELGGDIEITSVKRHRNQAKVLVEDRDINHFFKIISDYDIKFISEIKFTLEDYFMKFYDRNAAEAEGGEPIASYSN